jgi:hypothetical protein
LTLPLPQIRSIEPCVPFSFCITSTRAFPIK